MIKLLRITKTNQTFGVLLDENDLPICLTLELPWRENKRNSSCIPIGIYQCDLVKNDKFKEVYQISNVENRSGILIHPGNTISDSQGCILLGKEFGEINGKPAVLKSVLAFQRLKEIVGEGFKMKISWI